jgi:WD40 repeat protein
VSSVAYSPDGQYIVSSSADKTIGICVAKTHSAADEPSKVCTENPHYYLQPDPDGWVKDSQDGFLYWVPPAYRRGLHTHALLTIPQTSHIRSVSLDFEHFVYGTAWSQIFESVQA